ncbi:hypothetical protein [Laceyella putida]|uniref:Uncharacterized protein n=1 Tax=Laceyella putida TaxID=110101 RepID=A0ABW2RF32_9BACL
MKKAFSIFGSLAVALVVLLGFSGGASAYNGTGYFSTEDGKIDGTVTVNTKYAFVGVYDLEAYNSYGYDRIYEDASMLKVRLCSYSTGNCTSYKRFTLPDSTSTYPYVHFPNMRNGKYYIDIIDTWPDYSIRGTYTARDF